MRVLRSTAFRRTLLVLLVLAVLFVGATARLFVWPATDHPAHADAVVALGGDPGQLRAKKAIHLAGEGYAPVVVVSRGGNPEAPCPAPVAGIRIICFRADPLDTRGEAEHVAALIRSEHWKRIILVPERSQATRARMLFERCTDARLIVVPEADPRSRLVYAIPYEWGALVKALVLQRAC